ncbi:MAG: hypothetical protein WD274_11460 [Acidimicrobiia bacterium]
MNSPRHDSIGSSEPDDSTLPEDPSPREYGREKWLRNSTILIVVSVVVLGALGILGVKASTATDDDSGYRMKVTYAAVTRGGLATPLAIEVGTEDGSALPEVVTIRVSAGYLALFDDNGMEPTPVNSFNSEGFTSWDFEVPPGESTLEVVLDARLEPAVQWGEAASAELWIEGERTLSTEFRSWVMP